MAGDGRAPQRHDRRLWPRQQRLDDRGGAKQSQSCRVGHAAGYRGLLLTVVDHDELAAWLGRYTDFWSDKLDALAAHLDKGEPDANTTPENPR